MIKWELRFSPKQIGQLAAKYDAKGEQDTAVLAIGARVRDVGRYSRKQFIDVCDWKTRGRSRRHYSKNTDEEVSAITQLALSTSIERLRVGALQALEGVGLPTASALLHLAHSDGYPIWDRRALWSLGLDALPPYTFQHWWSYVRECRRIAQACGVDMRTLDRALWQYSEDNQTML